MNNLLNARRYLVDLLKADPTNEQAIKLLKRLDQVAMKTIDTLVDNLEDD